MNVIYDVPHANTIQMRTIVQFLDYYDGLVDNANDEDYSAEEREAFKAEVDEYDLATVAQLRDMFNSGAEEFISERYWLEYAKDLADELEHLTERVRRYFNYQAYADDLTSDYSCFEYDGVTYYALS